MLDWYNIVLKGSKTNEELATIGNAWVDVRDLALAHVVALEKEGAGGQRLLMAAGENSTKIFVSHMILNYA